MTTVELENVVAEIVERLRPFEPVRVYLFGSHARGLAREGSDVDLLVVLPRLDGKRTVQVRILRALAPLRVPKDVVVTTPDELESRGDAIGTVFRQALREGRVIYGMDDRDAETWLRYAAEDLEAAELYRRGSGFAPRVACYQAQQAAEKGLEAVLVADGRPFPPTRNLRVLRDLVAPGRRTATVDVDLAWLTAWNIRGRYPGDWEEATPTDAEQAVAAARTIVSAADEDVRGDS